jgi:hypothetical protein
MREGSIDPLRKIIGSGKQGTYDLAPVAAQPGCFPDVEMMIGN